MLRTLIGIKLIRIAKLKSSTPERGKRGVRAPSALHLGEQEEQKLPFLKCNRILFLN